MHAEDLLRGFGERARKTSRAGETKFGNRLAAVGNCGTGERYERRARTWVNLSVSDIAVNEGGELGLGKRPDLGRLDIAVLEQHQGRNPANAVLGGRGLVL